MPEQFELQIVAYCCHYCAYAAADLAGSMRSNYPTNVKIIKLPCTGRVDVLYLLEALEHGADGVLVAGCMEGDCHFRNGNLYAKKRVIYTKELLKQIGLEPDRVEMYNLSSAMGNRFAEIVHEFTERIRTLGSNPIGKGRFKSPEEKISIRLKKGGGGI